MTRAIHTIRLRSAGAWCSTPPWTIDTYFDRVKDAGAEVVQEPTDQFWGHRDWGITDPDGYLLFISKVTQVVSADAMREAALAGSPAD